MKICLKCGLNWIADDEEFCTVCVRKKVERPVWKYTQKGGELGRQYYDFLADCGYKEVTDNDKPSTIHSYVTAIEKVCRWECLTWLELAKNIKIIVKEYDFGGKKEQYGNQSHRTVYNALVAYAWFVKKNNIY